MGFFDKLNQLSSEMTKSIKDELQGDWQGKYSSTPPRYSEPSEMPIAHSEPLPEESNVNQDVLGIGCDLYSPKLNKLIEMALADGQLTDKEKQVLFKNAEKEGIDLDEFEMVLDAMLYERTKAIQQTPTQQMVPPPTPPQSAKCGNVKKCPACGAALQSFQTCCPDCGHELNGVEVNASIERLFEMLNKIEAQRQTSSVLSSFFVQPGEDKISLQKKECIKSFPIPNTREAILEFLCMAVPLAKKKGFFTDEAGQLHNAFATVWKNKCEQIIMKARFAMKDDKATLAEIEYYAKELKIK